MSLVIFVKEKLINRNIVKNVINKQIVLLDIVLVLNYLIKKMMLYLLLRLVK